MEYIIAGLIAAVATIVVGGINHYSTEKTNEANKEAVESTNETNQEINQANLDFQAAQTQAAWEREDTSYSRQVADLQRAGLSPLAISGGFSTSSPLGAPTPIAMQAPTYAAPKVDPNSLMQSILESSKLSETGRHNKAGESAKAVELTNQAAQIKIEADKVDLGNKQLEATIKQNAATNDILMKNYEELVRNNNLNHSLKQREANLTEFTQNSAIALKQLEKQLNGKDVPYTLCKTPAEYELKMAAWNTAYRGAIKEIGATRSGQGSSESHNVNGGFNLAGTGADAGVGNQSSQHTYSDYENKQNLMLSQFYKNNPYPVADFDGYFEKYLGEYNKK